MLGGKSQACKSITLNNCKETLELSKIFNFRIKKKLYYNRQNTFKKDGKRINQNAIENLFI